MNGEFDVPFHRLLRTLREQRGLTQKELADLSALSDRALRNLESGRVLHPRRNSVELLCKALDADAVTRARLLGAAFGTAAEGGLGRGLRIPEPMDRFVGRAAEAAALATAVEGGQARFVGVTGVGGVGKTRLAAEVAQSLRGEAGRWVLWVSADTGHRPTSSADRVVLDALAADDGAVDGLARQVGERRTLIVLDGLVDVDAAEPAVRRLLASCPNLRALVTTTSPWSARGSRLHRVEPLVDAGADLLMDRACSVRTDFRASGAEGAAIEELCGLLDHLPLAIEIAAAYCALIGPMGALEVVRGAQEGDGLPGDFRAAVDAVRRSCASLGEEHRRYALRLAGRAGAWSVEGAARELAVPPSVVGATAKALVAAGLARVSGDDLRISLLHLARIALQVPSAPARPPLAADRD